jgi:hypothetical protein
MAENQPTLRLATSNGQRSEKTPSDGYRWITFTCISVG